MSLSSDVTEDIAFYCSQSGVPYTYQRNVA